MKKVGRKVASSYIRKVFFNLFFTEQMLPFLKLIPNESEK